MYYVAPIKKNGKDVYPKWFQCYKCDVKWLDIDNKCWYCGSRKFLEPPTPVGALVPTGTPPPC